MTVNSYGFDPDRDEWSRDASVRLLPAVLGSIMPYRKIVWAWESGIDRLDKYYAVDAIVQTPRRNIALAIRFRGYSYWKRFGDITIRYDSLQNLGKALEIQKSIARFIFYGWLDTDPPVPGKEMVDWHLIWLQRLVDLHLRGVLPHKGPYPNTDGSSRLVAFTPELLRKHKLIYKSKTVIDLAGEQYWQDIAASRSSHIAAKSLQMRLFDEVIQ